MLQKNILASLPIESKLIVLKKKNEYYYFIKNSNQFFLYKIENSYIPPFFDKWSNSLNLIKKGKSLCLENRNVNSFFYNWNNFNYSKIKFTGKGYKLDKYLNKYYFFFNYSHIKLLKTLNLINFRLKKQKIMFIWKSTKSFLNLTKNITHLRYFNKYTKRGLRISRMRILTKNKRKK